MEIKIFETDADYVFIADGKEYHYPKEINGEKIDLQKYKNEVEKLAYAKKEIRAEPIEIII